MNATAPDPVPAMPTRHDFGDVGGTAVERVRLASGGLAVDLLTIGAAVHRVIVDGRAAVFLWARFLNSLLFLAEKYCGLLQIKKKENFLYG